MDALHTPQHPANITGESIRLSSSGKRDTSMLRFAAIRLMADTHEVSAGKDQNASLPRLEYAKRLIEREGAVARKQGSHIRIGYWKVAVAGAAVAFAWLRYVSHEISGYWLLGALVVYAMLALVHERILRARSRADAAGAFYRRGNARLNDRWAGGGETGERFRDPKHVYADDLDIFGRGSLFELLSTARTAMGEERLASWLLAPASAEQIRERQAAVEELRPHLDLREQIGVVGSELRPRIDPQKLIEWAESPLVFRSLWLRWIVAALALSVAATGVWALAGGPYQPVVALLAVTVLIRRAFTKRAEKIVSGANANAEGLELFAKILRLVEGQNFQSEKLARICGVLNAARERASAGVSSLARIIYWVDAREGLMARIADWAFLYTVQVAFAAEAWRARSGKELRAWIDVAAEMEALLALSAYAYEHPDDPFPEIAEGAAEIVGEALAHPLLPSATSVRNSVALGRETRVLLVSGSNMSGKSTYLRTVGINAVMAIAGAPVRAKSLRLTPLAIGTRMRTADSLQEGRSGFYSEVLRIRQVFDLLKGNLPVLFLFDELLEGTNSRDRRIGAEGLLAALIRAGAIGIVTTHDLALTEVAQSLDGASRNAHFQDHIEAGKMRFDYTLREGIVSNSNAIELMRLAGLDV